MTSPPGADDALAGALTNQERAALAAWAEDGDVPDGFADRVVAAFMAERLGEADDADEAEAAAVEPRAAMREGRVVRLVGWVAAIAAAAAVMLMVRVLPRASEVELVADARSAAELAAEPEHPPAQSEPPPVATSSTSSPEQVVAVLGADAGRVLAQHCSPCHDSTDREAKPEALQVFDLEQPQWWITMSEEQLEEARTRVQQLGAASDDDRRTVDAFVEARLRRPSHAG